MDYHLPQNVVFLEQRQRGAGNSDLRSTVIVGGHAYLARYAIEAERESASLGYYDPSEDTCYSWPGRPAGAQIDSSYTKLYIKDALLQYFSDLVGAGDAIAVVSGRKNRIRADATVWATNGADYPHSAALGDRGVKVGDIAHIFATIDSELVELWTFVAGFVGEPVAAVTAAATADAANPATQSAPSATATQTAGAENCVGVDAIDQSGYDGLATGDINETYTIEVIQGSTGGDATTAILRVRSASGNDDALAVTPSAFGSPTAIGANGLLVTFDDAGGSCSVSASVGDVPVLDFVVGQKWEVECGMAFTKPVATSSGTYTGTKDAIYVIEVTKGGLWADLPQITVTSNIGHDRSGPTTVTAVATNVAAGTKGVLVQFSGNGLRKGDRYSIQVTAASTGDYQTLVLGHNLPQDILDEEPDLSVELYIKDDIQVSRTRYGVPGQYNWTQSATQICALEGMTATYDEWTVDDELVALPVYSAAARQYGEMFVEFRAWRSDLVGTVRSMSQPSEIDGIDGDIDQDNPLKLGMDIALDNNNGRPVFYTAVADPSDPDSWDDVLVLLDGQRDYYNLVPLSDLQAVRESFEGHVNTQSAPEQGCRRRAWFAESAALAVAVVSETTSTDEEAVLATIEDDPDASGTQYTLFTITSDNINLLDLGVVAGDVVRAGYTTDGYDGETYVEYVVDEVLSAESFRTTTGPSAAVSVASKIEIWHTRTTEELVAKLRLKSGFNNRRIFDLVMDSDKHDKCLVGGIEVPHYFFCAAAAALSSGVLPHQGITNPGGGESIEIVGIQLATENKLFNLTQIKTLLSSGVQVWTQDRNNGAVYCRHAVSTGNYDNINDREEMISRNQDDIVSYMDRRFAPYIGISNVTPSMEAVLDAELKSAISDLSNRNKTQRLGGQVIGGEIMFLGPHPTLQDEYVVEIEWDQPYPFNRFNQYMSF